MRKACVSCAASVPGIVNVRVVDLFLSLLEGFWPIRVSRRRGDSGRCGLFGR